jgi:hypothetical protein
MNLSMLDTNISQCDLTCDGSMYRRLLPAPVGNIARQLSPEFAKVKEQLRLCCGICENYVWSLPARILLIISRCPGLNFGCPNSFGNRTFSTSSIKAAFSGDALREPFSFAKSLDIRYFLNGIKLQKLFRGRICFL